MKAVIFTEYGGPEVLHVTEVPDPVPSAGQVVVDVIAASINGVDYKVRRGGGIYKAKFPHILGRDFSGVVSAVGAGVSDTRLATGMIRKGSKWGSSTSIQVA